MKQLYMQIATDLKRSVFRNIFFMIFSMVMPIGFYLMFTSFFSNDMQASELQGYYTQSLMNMTTYGVMISSLFTLSNILIEDRNMGIKRAIRISPLPEYKYYISKIIMQFIVNIFVITSVFLVGIIVNSIDMELYKWVFSGMWILFSTLPIMALAPIVGQLKNVSTSSVVNNIILMPLAIFSGLWWPIELFPEVIQRAAKILPSYYSATGTKSIIKGEVPSLFGIFIILSFFMVFMIISIYTNKNKQESR